MRTEKVPSLQSLQTPLMLAFVFVFFLLAAARADAATPNPGHPWTETGDGLFSVTGPTSLHLYTFPDANATVLTTDAAVTADQGGTGITSYAVGDLLYASGTSTLSKLNAGLASQVLTIIGGVPTWQNTTSSQWTTSSTDIYYNTGSIGIGTATPTSLLHLYKTVDDLTPALYIYSTNADSEITIDGSASPGGGTAAVNLTSGTQTWQMSINGIDTGNNWNVQDTTSGTVPLTVEKGTGNVGLGTMFPGERLEVNGGIMLNTVTAKPTCDATHRGTQWFVQGGAGVQDTFEVCAKDAGDAYAWRTIY